MRQRQDLIWKVVAAVAGAVAVILAALIAWNSDRYKTNQPIFATQTAEQRLTQGSQLAGTQAAMMGAIQTAQAHVTEAQFTAQASVAGAATQMADAWAQHVQQTAQAQPPPATAAPTVNPLSLPLMLEQLPASVFPFSGTTDPKKDFAGASLVIKQRAAGDLNYKFDFTLPDHEGGWAGLAFTFDQPQDFSGYAGIELVLTYGNQLDDGDMILKDAKDKESRLPIGPAVSHTGGVTVQGEDMQQTISVPLKYFSGIDLKFIKELTFLFDSSRTKGSSSLTVNSWKLVGE